MEALGLRGKRGIPFELAHQADESTLATAGDEFFQGAGNRRRQVFSPESATLRAINLGSSAT